MGLVYLPVYLLVYLLIYLVYLPKWSVLMYVGMKEINYMHREYFRDIPFCVATLEARQVHGICTHGKIFTEPLGCLACLYSWVGEPLMLQAACLSACLCMSQVMALAPQHGTHGGTCPTSCLSSSSPPAGSPYLLKY